MRLASGIEDADRPIAIQLDLKDPIRGIKWRFGAFRHHRRHELPQSLLVHTGAKSADRETLRRSKECVVGVNGVEVLVFERFTPATSFP
jgi:hypothetical protein